MASTPKSLTLTNTGTGALTVDDVQIAGPDLNDFTVSSDCGASLAAGASCRINITFSPLSTGARLAYLKVFDNSTNSPQAAELHGTGGIGAADFSVTSSAAAQTVVAGQTATYTLTLSGSNGFNGSVAFSCSDSIAASKCLVSPNPVTVSGSTPAKATVTIDTSSQSSAPSIPWRPKLPPGPKIPLLLAFMWLAALLALTASREHCGRWLRPITLPGLYVAAMLALCCGCASNSAGSTRHGTPTGTYTITVTSTSGNISHNTVLNLNVQ